MAVSQPPTKIRAAHVGQVADVISALLAMGLSVSSNRSTSSPNMAQKAQKTFLSRSIGDLWFPSIPPISPHGPVSSNFLPFPLNFRPIIVRIGYTNFLKAGLGGE